MEVEVERFNVVMEGGRDDGGRISILEEMKA